MTKTPAHDARGTRLIGIGIASIVLLAFVTPHPTWAEEAASPQENTSQKPTLLQPELVEQFEQAAARASRSEPGSALVLARFYDYGLGTKPDAAKAISLYKIAVAEKSLPAARSLGVIYAIGNGVPRNVQEASEWFKTAATLGGSYPCMSIGVGALKDDTESTVALCAISALTRTLVAYPDEARRALHEGSVELGVNFKRLEIRVVKSEAGPILEESAKRDIKRFIKLVPLPDALLAHDEEIIYAFTYHLTDSRARSFVGRGQRNR